MSTYTPSVYFPSLIRQEYEKCKTELENCSYYGAVFALNGKRQIRQWLLEGLSIDQPKAVKKVKSKEWSIKCLECRKGGREYMEKSPIPYPVIRHSYASPSTVAQVIHQKYKLAVPLYRQEKEWENLGASLRIIMALSIQMLTNDMKK